MRTKEPKNPINRADLYPFILDREWHLVTDLMASLAARISPEIAFQQFAATRVGDETDKEQFDKGVRSGTRSLVNKVISSMRQGGAVRQRGLSESSAIKYVLWFCWSCGERVIGGQVRPDHGLCIGCTEAIERLEDDESTED